MFVGVVDLICVLINKHRFGDNCQGLISSNVMFVLMLCSVISHAFVCLEQSEEQSILFFPFFILQAITYHIKYSFIFPQKKHKCAPIFGLAKCKLADEYKYDILFVK